jgi:hypothetical protein
MPKIEFSPCPLYGRVEHFACLFCKDRCHPLPVLMKMADVRWPKPGVFSVTEIIKPLQAIYRSRRCDIVINPMKSINAITGTANHAVIEDGLRVAKRELGRLEEIMAAGDDAAERLRDVYVPEFYGEKGFDFYHRAEESFKEEIIPGYFLSGRADYYDVMMAKLTDYKNSKAYTVKKTKRAAESKVPWNAEDYFAQVNIYRTFLYPEAKKLELYFPVMGWNRNEKEISEIEQISVPTATPETVRLWVKDRIKKIAEVEEGRVEVPRCPKGDLWLDRDGNPNRCMHYCVARETCPQAKEMLGQ